MKSPKIVSTVVIRMNNPLENSKYYKLVKDGKKREENRPKRLTPEEKNRRTKQWMTFWRRNVSIYAEKRLKIKLKPFQRIMLDLMANSDVFMAICSRGLSKQKVSKL